MGKGRVVVKGRVRFVMVRMGTSLLLGKWCLRWKSSLDDIVSVDNGMELSKVLA